MRPGRDRRRWLATGLLTLIASAWPVAAQNEPAQLPTNVLLAADEQHLWLAVVQAKDTVIYRRGVSDPFQDAPPLTAPVERMAGAAGRLYVCLTDGRFYTLAGSTWMRGGDLPGRAVPLDLVAVGAHVYALVASPPSGELSRVATDAPPAASQPFEPGGAAFSVLRFDGRDWAGVAPCPADLPAGTAPRLQPRLLIVQEQLQLFWWSADTQRLHMTALDAETNRWSKPEALPTIEGLRGYWLTTVGGVPALVAAARTGTGDESLSVLRRLGGDDAGWRAAAVHVSALPTGIEAYRYDWAAGFNQQIALRMASVSEEPYLRFARIDADPAERSARVADIIAGRLGPPRGPVWVSYLTMAALFGVLLTLFFFRRRAMVEDVKLPPVLALALTFQRLIGFVVDFGPFMLVAAALLGVDWQGGLRELFAWAAGSGAAGGRLPPTLILVWWGVSVAMHALYCAIMELATQRTVGKILAGTRVTTENGARPSLVQMLARNLLRMIELLPPLWVLGFLVVLSRNRQRVGDVFARTVVVRRAPLRPPPKNSNSDRT